MTLVENAFHAFLLIIIIMGPFTGLPVFLKITENFDNKKRVKSANKAIFAALLLLLFFLFLGESLLRFFGISFEAFRIAGGVLLLLLGIEYVFHLNFKEKRSGNWATEIVVPFAMPLIVGPGVITTTILLTNEVGYIPTLIGGLGALMIYWLFLYFSNNIARGIGHQGIEIVARFMGLLLMAIAVDMMKGGIAGFIKTGLGG
jgi:multiple antibiotic resistance protein